MSEAKIDEIPCIFPASREFRFLPPTVGPPVRIRFPPAASPFLQWTPGLRSKSPALSRRSIHGWRRETGWADRKPAVPCVFSLTGIDAVSIAGPTLRSTFSTQSVVSHIDVTTISRLRATKPDINGSAYSITLSARDQRRDSEAERPRGLEVDDEFECGRLLDRKISRLSSLQDAVDMASGPAKDAENAGAVGDEDAPRRTRGRR